MAKLTHDRIISRRKALNIGLGSLVALTILSVGKLKVLSYVIHVFKDRSRVGNNHKRTFKLVDRRPLKAKAKAKGLIYGAYVQADHHQFAANLALQSLLLKQCAMTVAPLYWTLIRPTVDTYNFERPDYFVKFAADRQLAIRAHPLVWYNANPPWFKEQINAQNARDILTKHIQIVVKHYQGKMHSWDVVNEAIEPKDGRADGLRKNIWLEFLGEDYIEYAFRVAAQTDPQATLIYNETDLEYDEPNQIATLKLLAKLKSKGVPVRSLGIQSHLRSYRDDFNPKKFRAFMREVADLGLKIMITELDVIDKALPADIAIRDRLVAGIYEDYLDAVLAEKSVTAVVSWGLTDMYTWHNDYVPRDDRQLCRPLPYDRSLRPKLAWNAIARALDRAPKR